MPWSSACAATSSPPARLRKSSRPRSARCAIPSSAASSESSIPRAASTGSSSASSGRDKPRRRWALCGPPDRAGTSMSAAVSQDKFFYGGQAVLEGVMMRGRTTYAVAVRKPDGEIQVLRERLRSIIYTHPLCKLPLLRALAGLWEQLPLGMKALMWPANIQAAAEQVELSATTIRVTMAIAVAGALLFFLGVPLLAAGFLSRGHGNLFFGVVDGAVRIALLLLYLYAISFKAEIARLFAYHGAEHQTINAYEAGLPLDAPNVPTQSTLHPRCGAGFSLAVMVVSSFVFGLVGRPALPVLVLSRIVLIPLIAMLAYEFIRFAGRNRNNPIVKVLILPFLLTQKLTTREPDDRQLEVALAAFEAARQEEKEAAA